MTWEEPELKAPRSARLQSWLLCLRLGRERRDAPDPADWTRTPSPRMRAFFANTGRCDRPAPSRSGRIGDLWVKRWRIAGLLGAGGLALCWLPSCGVRYVVRSGYYQMELMAAREPVDEVLESHRLSAGQEQRLRMIADFKAYGKTLGLSATDNYETIAIEWRRQIWNLTACDPLSFTPRTWWFPIVGRMPYLGYFVEQDARDMEARMQAEGLEVYVRTAGAYSTLGWFKDPVLPGMLAWSEEDLAATVFHELAHATLWIPGSAMFNESFAEVVGVAAMHTWLVDTYGVDSPERKKVLDGEHDDKVLTGLLHTLCADLEGVFSNDHLDDAAKLARKAELYASIPDRILASEIRDKDRYVRWAKRSTWNNARLIQFKAYNGADDDFAAVLARHDLGDGRTDVLGFIREVGTITRPPGEGWVKDPFAALTAAAKVEAGR